MAKYTTEVRSICESKAGLEESKGFNNVDAILEESWDKIFTTQCTFFDNNYRPVLCKKILKHYYKREIGAETVGLWQLWLNTKLEEIMPYYNQLYQSALIQFDPLHNIDMQRTKSVMGSEAGTVNDTMSGSHASTIQSTDGGTMTVAGNSSGSGSSTGSGTSSENSIVDEGHSDVTDFGKSDAYSDTPQGSLTNVDQNAYLTNYRKIGEDTENHGSKDVDTDIDRSYNDSSSNQASEMHSDVTTYGKTNSKTDQGTTSGGKNRTSSLNTTENYIESVVGSNGTYNLSKLLQDFRDTFLNIDMLVINEFKDLFMKLW